jgi:hypothetical protein
MDDIPQEVKQLLVKAAENWENTALSEQYIEQALHQADDNLDVLIGAYRFFFYKNKPTIALTIAKKVLNIIQETEKLPIEWSQLHLILANRQDESLIRLYINAYAAEGFILAKLGQLEAAKLITQRVKEIDHHRESCATTVFDVLTATPDEDD